jgi:hypothetical protein
MVVTVVLLLLLQGFIVDYFDLAARACVAVGSHGLGYRTSSGRTKQFAWSELFVRDDAFCSGIYRRVRGKFKRLRLPVHTQPDVSSERSIVAQALIRWQNAVSPENPATGAETSTLAATGDGFPQEESPDGPQ